MNEKNSMVPVPMAAPAPGYHHVITGILLKTSLTHWNQITLIRSDKCTKVRPEQFI
jgi:hypothetical protein